MFGGYWDLSNIKDITKPESVYLKYVYNYMNRSIGVRFINTNDELEKTWEEAQFELSSKYQYEGINEHIWDYYLVFCCNFNEDDLDNKLRFKIESDRFCCRKYFLFGFPEKSFSKEKLIGRLFPSINSSKPIQLIRTETIIEKLGDELKSLVPPSFFTEEIDESEIAPFVESLITKGNLQNGK